MFFFQCLLKNDWNEFSPAPTCGRRTVKAAGTAGAEAFKSSLGETFELGIKKVGVTKEGGGDQRGGKNHFNLVPGIKLYDLKFPPRND